MNTNSLVQTLGYNTVANTINQSRTVSPGPNRERDTSSTFGRRKSDADVNNHNRVFRKSQVVIGDPSLSQDKQKPQKALNESNAASEGPTFLNSRAMPMVYKFTLSTISSLKIMSQEINPKGTKNHKAREN